MKLKIVTFLILTMLFGLVRNTEVSTNKSCEEIKSADGFSYRHECQGAKTIHVSRNERNIAVYISGEKQYSDPMMKLDNTSFFTKECTDLQILCIFSDGLYVKEKRLTFNITGNLTPVVKDLQETEKTPPKGPIIGESVAGIVLFSVIVWLCWSLGIKKTLLSLFHKIFTQRNQEATAQAKTDSDLNGNHSDVIEMNEIQPAIGQPAIDENERNSWLENVQAQSVDHQADGETPQALSLGNIYNNGTQPSKDGGADVPDGACNPRPMHRDMRDDPGGVTDRKMEDLVEIRDMQNGRPLVDRGRGKNENERVRLLPSQGGSIQRSNMTGEDVALVDKSCYDPNQLSKCSPAPDDDVKSGSMRKCGDHKH